MHRQFIFNNYWWIGPTAGLATIVIVWNLGADNQTSLVASVVAGTLAFCYFVQRQKLAETTLFHSLFTSFNERYAEMNGHLTELCDRVDLTSDDHDLIIDYFNLCAEEFLFFKEGYIHRDVWKSWCRGMLWYFNRYPFKDIWLEEIKSDSYYGLSIEIIEKGAA